ncbi:MAG TPA: DNA polymerase III subunit [Pirellulaceae bacterium]|nr:DNA polymerase III subunit [Pirellulaceae bacterium]
MSWSGVIGHRHVVERFRRGFQRDRLGSAYLFVGPRGVGKHTFARQLAKTLFCEQVTAEAFDACGQCQSCRLAEAGSHPDLLLVSKREDKSVFSIDLIVGEDEERLRTGLCHDIYLKPLVATRKIAILNDADLFNDESANALLKTLEEPPPRAMIILIGTTRERQVRTIQSRCQTVNFPPLSEDEVVAVLSRLPDLESPVEKSELAAICQGSVAQALLLTDSVSYDFRKEWLQRLATLDPWADGGGKCVIGYSEVDGKEAGSRRDRLLFAADVSLLFYRALLDHWSKLFNHPRDQQLTQAVTQAAGLWQRPWAALVDCIDRTIEFQRQIPTNVGAANAVEDWLIDLARLAAPRQVTGALSR